MPIRGENIGTAYVRILADGSGIDKSVRDALDDEGVFDEFEKHGRKGSIAWQEGWEKERAKAPNQQRLLDSIAGPLVKGDWLSKEFFRGKAWQTFESSIRKEFGEAGERARIELENSMLGGEMDFDRLNAQMENILPLIKKQRLAMEREAADETLQLRLDYDREFEQRSLALHEQAMQERMDLDREYETHIADLARQQELGAMQAAAYAEDERRSLRQRNQALKDLKTTYALLNRESGQLFAGSDFALGKGQLQRMVRDLRVEMDDLNVTNSVWNESLRDIEYRLDRTRPALDRFIINLDRTSFFVGKAFGRGSRNDFLNFIGVVAGGVTRLATTILPRATRSLLNYTTGIGDAFGKGMGPGFAKIIGDAGKGILALSGALAGLFFIIGPLVSMLSLLAGALVALSSTVILGLIGSLGALAGAFAPVVAGIGVMVLAFQNAPKEAKRALNEVKDAFSGLGDVAAEGMFANITEQADRFIKVLGNMKPLTREIGLAISGIGDYWLELMEGQGFKNFRAAMEDFLPDAVGDLGRILGNVFGGLGGVLVGLIPTTERFLTWLEDITGEFNKWANSSEGLNDIRTYFSNAAHSAAELGDFLGSAWDLLSTIMDAGRVSGDSLFASLTSTFDSWNRTLQGNPEILRDWFEAAEDFGRALGEVVIQAGNLFSALDNPASREIIVGAFEAIGNAMENMMALFGPIIRGFIDLNGATGGLAGSIVLAAAAMPKLIGVFSSIQGSAGGLVTNLRNVETRLTAIRGLARGAAGVAGLVTLTESAKSSNDAISALGGAAGGALLGFSLGGPWGAAIGAGAGALLSLSTNADKATESLNAGRPAAQNYKDTLDSLTGSATQATREMAALSLQEAGAFDNAAKLGISTRDLTAAMTGNAGAAKRVEAAMSAARTALHDGSVKRGSEEWLALRDAVNKLSPDLSKIGYDLDEQQRKFREVITAATPLKQLYEGFPPRLITRIRAEGAPESLRDVVQLNRQFDLTPKEVRTLLKLNNIDGTLRDVRRLTKGFKDIPKEVQTEIQEDGFKTTFFKMQRLIEQYDLTPKQVRTILKETGFKDTERKIDLLKQAADNLVDKPYTAKLDGDKGPLDATLGRARNDVGSFVNGNYTARLRVESNAASVAAAAAAALRNIPDEIVHLRTVRTGGAQYAGRSATGGIFTQEQTRLISESGPEAVVPLNRPLGEVDPAVRWLSAIAQGQQPAPVVGKRIDVGGVTIVSPSADPHAVATETINAIMATGY